MQRLDGDVVDGIRERVGIVGRFGTRDAVPTDCKIEQRKVRLVVGPVVVGRVGAAVEVPRAVSVDKELEFVWRPVHAYGVEDMERSSSSEQPPGSAVLVPHECFAEWAVEYIQSLEFFEGGRWKFSMMSISPHLNVAGRHRG